MTKKRPGWGRRRGRSHVDEYDRVDDGRLILGTPCFTGPRLKRRFASEGEAAGWMNANPGMTEMRFYACHMCGGWHLTTKDSKGGSAA